jgi:hypothetical protein
VEIGGRRSATRGRAGRPWVQSPPPPVIADGGVGVHLPRDPDGGGGASGKRSAGVPRPRRSRPRKIPRHHLRRAARAVTTRHGQLGCTFPCCETTSPSPRQVRSRFFVENDGTICADLGPAHDVFTKGYHQLWFHKVDVDRMDEVVDLFYDEIATQAGVAGGSAGNGVLGFDLSRMRIVVRGCRRRLLEASERRPASTIIDGVVRNFGL